MPNQKHIHILAIGGTFMASLAVLAKQCGYKVTGTDYKLYPPMSDVLSKNNIEYSEDYHDFSNLVDADCIIVGNAISRGNPSIEYVLENHLQFRSGPQWLFENILYNKHVLAVTGTHGKTTTSSMLAHILHDNNLSPGFLIGGFSNNFECSSRLTNSKYFVIEADEYDTAFFDKRPKFLHYFPSTCIINNIEYDHADIYNNLAEIEKQFGYLLRTIPSNGKVVSPHSLKSRFSEEDQVIYKYSAQGTSRFEKVVHNFDFYNIYNSNTEKLNSQECKVNAVMTKSDGSEFEVYDHGELQGTVKWNCLGEHNVNNALAAILAASHVGLSYQQAIKSLSSFKGVARRLDKKHEFISDQIVIFDDFAHHPTAIATTLSGLKQHYITDPKNNDENTNRRLVSILDFGSYSMRNKIHPTHAFKHALDSANLIYFYQNEEVTWDGRELLDQIIVGNNDNKQGYFYKNSDSLIESLAKNIIPGDVVVFMSNSGFNKNISSLIDELKKNYR